MNLQHYLNEQFNGLDLMTEGFSSYPFAFHITLEKELYQFEDNSDELNRRYFENVYRNAITLFEELFDAEDDVFLVTQIRSEDPVAFPSGIYKKYVKNPDMYKLKYKKTKLLDEQEQIIQYSLLCKNAQIKYKPIIQEICNQDFNSLRPRFKIKHTYYPEILFVNASRHRIVHFYDDRGGFIILNSSKDYEDMKSKYGNLADGE